MSLSYRVSQFWKALAAAPSQEDLLTAERLLSAELMNLFLRMQPGEQSHSMQVCLQLVKEGYESQDLLTAALLHDVGKSRHPLRAWERALIVIVRRLSPESIERWGNGKVHGWKRPFAVALQHPEWGAEMVRAVGASELTIRLIQRHQERCQSYEGAENELLMVLQKVDNES